MFTKKYKNKKLMQLVCGQCFVELNGMSGHLLSISLQLLLLDFEDILDVVCVSGRLTPELSPHLCFHHFP